MITLFIPSLGVNENHVVVPISVQEVPELVEYDTRVRSDGHRVVLVIVHVVLTVSFIHVLCVYVVHMMIGALGAVASIRIFLFAHNELAVPGVTRVSVASFVEASLIVHPSNVRAVVFR
jgi:hypothetical protein